MTNNDKKEKIRVSSTKRRYRVRSTDKNKGLEPIIAGKRFIIGYDSEIHGEDSYEFTYMLPVGAIKRLIKSYFEEMESVDQESAYLNQSGSHGLRMYSYADRMLGDLRKQLDKHLLPGEKIIDEVFDAYFKKSYDKMKGYQENHPNQGINDFERCKDPECCRLLTLWEKIVQPLNSLYFKPEWWIWQCRRKLRTLKNGSSKTHQSEDIPF